MTNVFGQPIVRSIRRKLLGPMLVAGLLGSLVSVVAIRENSTLELMHRLRQRAELIADMINYTAESVSRPGELQRIVAAVGAEPEINLVMVVAGQPARVVACTRQSWLGRSLDDLPARGIRENLEAVLRTKRDTHSFRTASPEYGYTAPLLLSQPEFAHSTLGQGAVVVSLDARPAQAKTSQAFWRFSAAYLALLACLAALGYRLLKQVVLAPISAINHAVRAPDRHLPTNWTETRSDDEIGRLAQTLQQALQQADKALRELRCNEFAFDQHCILAITDARGRITQVNDRFCDISQYARDELLGKTHALINSGHHPPEFFADLWTTIGRGQVWRGEICNRAQGGSLYWVATTIVPLPGPDGKPAKYIAIRTDITARKIAEGEIRQTNRNLEEATARANHMALTAEAASAAKSAFLATMSHEIRTPMNGVIGFTNLLLDSPLTEEQRDHANTIRHSGEALLTIINDILDLSKIEAGRMTIECQPCDLARQVQEVIGLLSASATAQQLALHMVVSENLSPGVLADPIRVHQVLLNLVGNALKFTPAGGRVTVRVNAPPRAEPGADANAHAPSDSAAPAPHSGTTEVTRATGAFVMVRVVDTGIGIPRDKQASLFNMFSQADSSTTRKFGGTGLGLAICKRLVEMMGGEIGLESDAGKGATFWFTLPAAALPAQPPAPSPAIRPTAESSSAIPGDADPRPGQTPSAAEGGPGRSAPAEAQRCTSPAHLPSAHVRSAAAPARLRVLVAEDTVTNQLLATKMLTRFGCEVEIAVDGREAVDQFQQHRFDVILMDCQMPEMDGFEATAEIRRLERSQLRPRPVPIIALTANAMQGDEERCKAAGMDDYLAKPFSPEKLKQLLERWARREAPTVAP